MPLAGEIVVILGSGQIGQALYHELARRECAGCALLGHNEADVTDFESLRDSVATLEPTLIFHTAAFTKVNGCERNPGLAFAVNTCGTANVTNLARELNARMVYFSTDYVFPGKDIGAYNEDDPPQALNVYGQSKLRGEEFATEYEGSTVIRTAEVFAPAGRNFPLAILAKYGDGGKIEVVNDEYATPTYAPHFAAAVLDLVAVAEHQLYHLRGPEELTYYEFARRIFVAAGLPVNALVATTTDRLGLMAKRPTRAVLSMDRYLAHDLPSMPALDEAISDFLSSPLRQA
jgi:dTDP-4-dehydrorhamnose reductase